MCFKFVRLLASHISVEVSNHDFLSRHGICEAFHIPLLNAKLDFRFFFKIIDWAITVLIQSHHTMTSRSSKFNAQKVGILSLLGNVNSYCYNLESYPVGLDEGYVCFKTVLTQVY